MVGRLASVKSFIFMPVLDSFVLLLERIAPGASLLDEVGRIVGERIDTLSQFYSCLLSAAAAADQPH